MLTCLLPARDLTISETPELCAIDFDSLSAQTKARRDGLPAAAASVSTSVRKPWRRRQLTPCTPSFRLLMRGHASSRQAALGGVQGGNCDLPSAPHTAHCSNRTTPLEATHSFLGPRRLLCRASDLQARAGPPRAACRDMTRHGGTTMSSLAIAACLGTALRGGRCAAFVSATWQLYWHLSGQIENLLSMFRHALMSKHVEHADGRCQSLWCYACLLSLHVGRGTQRGAQGIQRVRSL